MDRGQSLRLEGGASTFYTTTPSKWQYLIEASGATGRRHPVRSRNMAPNLQLTYLDRVLLEIIETERMYVRDLRMIVEVSDPIVT